MATENKVTNVQTFGRSDRALDLVRAGTLVVMDCEGGERDYIDLKKYKGLAKCDLIVECHDFKDAGMSAMLLDRVKATHDAHFVTAGPDADPARFPLCLASFTDEEKKLAVHEERPANTKWLIATAKEY